MSFFQKLCPALFPPVSKILAVFPGNMEQYKVVQQYRVERLIQRGQVPNYNHIQRLVEGSWKLLFNNNTHVHTHMHVHIDSPHR